jgi:hypothetical protein
MRFKTQTLSCENWENLEGLHTLILNPKVSLKTFGNSRDLVENPLGNVWVERKREKNQMNRV